MCVILIESCLILVDGRHAKSYHLQLGMSAVSLKISLECTVAKRLAQRILFLGEMIHSDKLILSAPELLHRQQKNLGFLFGCWKLLLFQKPFRGEQRWNLSIGVDRRANGVK